MRERIIPAVRVARIRRGKYVRIPTDWRGQVTDRQTIRKRESKGTRKLRNAEPRHSIARVRRDGRAPRVEEWLDA